MNSHKECYIQNHLHINGEVEVYLNLAQHKAYHIFLRSDEKSYHLSSSFSLFYYPELKESLYDSSELAITESKPKR